MSKEVVAFEKQKVEKTLCALQDGWHNMAFFQMFYQPGLFVQICIAHSVFQWQTAWSSSFKLFCCWAREVAYNVFLSLEIWNKPTQKVSNNVKIVLNWVTKMNYKSYDKVEEGSFKMIISSN